MTHEDAFDEGDVLRIRGNEYVVERVDVNPKRPPEPDRVIQYRLCPVDDGPEAILSPEYPGGPYTIQEFYAVDRDDIDVHDVSYESSSDNATHTEGD